MGYNPNMPHLQVDYRPLRHHLLTSGDIQVFCMVLHVQMACICGPTLKLKVESQLDVSWVSRSTSRY